MDKHATVPGLRNFIIPKSVLYSFDENYIRTYDMNLCIQAVSVQ